MSFWFCGNGPFAALCLERLISKGHAPELVLCSGPTISGRGKKLTPQKVEEVALNHNVPLQRVGALADEGHLLEKLSSQDFLLVVDFGQKVPQNWCQGAKFGAVNIHPSLLPKWRGAAPVQRALMNGDPTLGVSLFFLEDRMDAGAVISTYSRSRRMNDLADQVFSEMAATGSDLFIQALLTPEEARKNATDQCEEKATYASKIEKEERFVNLATTSALDATYQVAGLSPKPGAWLELEGVRLTLLECSPLEGSATAGQWRVKDEHLQVGTADGWLTLLRVIPAGKREMTGYQFALGRQEGK